MKKIILCIFALCASHNVLSMDISEKNLAQQELDLALDYAYNKAPQLTTNGIAHILKLAITAKKKSSEILEQLKELISQKVIINEPLKTKYDWHVLNDFFNRLWLKQDKDHAENLLLEVIHPCLLVGRNNWQQLHPKQEDPYASTIYTDQFFSAELMSTDSDTMSLKY